MQRLTGEFECKLDNKWRMRMPSSLVRQLAQFSPQFIINRGFEKNLILYPKQVWEQQASEIDDQLNIYNTKQRQFLRYFYRGASEVTMDGNDRLLLPKRLVQYAGIEKEVILFAFQHQIEIWSASEYTNMISQEPEDFAEIADSLFVKNEQSL